MKKMHHELYKFEKTGQIKQKVVNVNSVVNVHS